MSKFDSSEDLAKRVPLHAVAGQVLYLVSALHGFGAFNMVGDSTAQAEMCYWLAVCSHYVLLAGAFWLNVIAMDAARAASTDSQVCI